MKHVRTGGLFGAAFIAATALAATVMPAGAGTLDEIRERGYAIVAVANEPPYSDIKPDGYTALASTVL